MSNWQPIETAPNDFAAFLACDQWGQMWLCFRDADGKVGAYAESTQSLFRGADATHWMPLPKPPTSSQDQGEKK